jgi:hypothetical protein
VITRTGAIPSDLVLQRDEHVKLRRSWLLWALFGLFPLYWILGFAGFIQAVFGIVLIFMLFVRGGSLHMPKLFMAWVLYLVWAAVCAVQLRAFTDIMSFAWRWSIGLTALLLFLYIYNTPRERLPSRSVVAALGWFWIVAVAGGFFGMLKPEFTLVTLAQKMLGGLATNGFVKQMTTVRTASPTTFGNTGIHRPLAPFIFTNQWGSGYSMSLPFAIAWAAETRSKTWRTVLVFLIIISIVPLVASFDRGGWISTSFAVTYALLRLALSGNRRTSRAARHMIVVLAIVGLGVLASPLFQLINYRVQSNYSDKARSRLYTSSWTVGLSSPVFGYGATVPFTQVGISAALKYSVGTQGIFWTVLVSQGFVGEFFFLLFLVLLFFKTYRIGSSRGGRDPTARFWAHISIVAAGAQLFVYEYYPWGILIIFCSGAIALREWAPPVRTRRWGPGAYPIAIGPVSASAGAPNAAAGNGRE